jgi:hypothetical protein
MKVLSIILLSVPSVGQIASPRALTRVEGNTSTLDPFSSSVVPFRYLQVHDDLVGSPRTITGLAFRLDGAATTAANSVLLTIRLAEAATGVGAATPNATFSANHGRNSVTVLNSQWSPFPAIPSHDPFRDLLPRPFTHVVSFPAWHYSGASPLVWEVEVLARQTSLTTGRLDAVSGSAANPAPLIFDCLASTCRATPGGPACQLVESTTPRWSQGVLTLDLALRNLAANQPGGLMFAAATLASPLAVPGSDGAPSGTCRVACSPDVVFGGVVGSSGALSFQTPFPVSSSLNGARLFMQGFGHAPGMNAWGLATTEASYVCVVAPRGPAPVGNVVLRGSLGSTGTATAHSGLVTRFL